MIHLNTGPWIIHIGPSNMHVDIICRILYQMLCKVSINFIISLYIVWYTKPKSYFILTRIITEYIQNKEFGRSLIPGLVRDQKSFSRAFDQNFIHHLFCVKEFNFWSFVKFNIYFFQELEQLINLFHSFI